MSKKPDSLEKLNIRRCLKLFILLSITAIALFIASAAYILFTKQNSDRNQPNSSNEIQATLATLTRQQQELRLSLNHTNQFIEAKQADLQNQFNALIQHINSYNTYDKTQQESWLLKKVRYYLELAQINSRWSHHQDTSIMLLQEANTLLQKIPDEHVYALKQTIAKEIAALKSIPHIDVADLMKKLDQTQAYITKLPFIPFKLTPTPQTNLNTWSKHWQASLDLLQKLIIIRHHQTDEPPTLSPRYQLLLREQMIMDLQEAQWAVLHDDAQLYQESLKRLLNAIQHNYALKEAETTNAVPQDPHITVVITQLHQLQHIQLNPSKPSLTQALTELNEIIHNNTSHLITIRKPNTSSSQQGHHEP